MCFTKSFSKPTHLLDTIREGFLYAKNVIPLAKETIAYMEEAGIHLTLENSCLPINAVCLTCDSVEQFDENNIEIFGPYKIKMSSEWIKANPFYPVQYYGKSQDELAKLHALAIKSDYPIHFLQLTELIDHACESEFRAIAENPGERIIFEFSDILSIILPDGQYFEEIKKTLHTRYPTIDPNSYPIVINPAKVPDINDHDIDILIFGNTGDIS